MPKKVSLRKGEEESMFFINIENPTEIRRTLVDASQQIVEGMKSYEKYKKLKAQKLQKIEALKGQTNDIKTQVAKLRSFLPTVNGFPRVEQRISTESVTVIELEQLNKEIEKLEQELRRLK